MLTCILHIYLVYIYKDMYVYMCLYISKINYNNDTDDWRTNQDYFAIIKYLHFPQSGIMLIESGHRLAINVYCNSRAATNKT